MLAKRRGFLFPSTLILTLAYIGIYFTSARTETSHPPADKGVQRVAAETEPTYIGDEGSAAAGNARRRRLHPEWDAALTALGDRVEKPGKERLTLAGTIQRAGDTQGSPFVAVYQQPGRLRFQTGQGLSTRTITFDGLRAGGLGGSLTGEEEALIEMLVCDTPEGFFNVQMGGATTRLLGQRFRADDGSAENYVGPYYDIYQMMGRVKTGGHTQQRLKLFHLNSDTQLLEIVRYRAGANGVMTDVEVQFGDWQKTQDQMIPRRIVRLENNQQVLTLTVTSVAVGPGVEDGIFAVSQD